MCPSCGARVNPEATRCDLCGTPLASKEGDAPSSQEDAPAAAAKPGAASKPESASKPGAASTEAGVYCNACGWKNPPGAKFCSQCGHRLQEEAAPVKKAALPAETEAPAEAAASAEEAPAETPGRMGRQVAVLVGGALLVVGALFAVTQWSQSADPVDETPPPPPTAAQQTGRPSPVADAESVVNDFAPGPLPESIRARAESLQAELEGLEGVRKRAKQMELVNLYVGAGLTDRAAVLQYNVAEAAGTTDAWARAGRLFFDWLMTVEPAERPKVAQLTVNAYERVLEERPGDVEARTNLATAYLDTNNPMQGVTEVKRVLEEAPDHLPARMLYGIMLAQIGRVDDATEQLERVQQIAGEGTPRYEQAQQLIERLEEARAGGTPAAPPSAAGPAG